MAQPTNWMTPASEIAAGRPLDTQSLARPLSDAERGLAEALETVFATGIHDMTLVAAELAARAVPAPVSGGTDWTLDKLAAELAALNDDLDATFEECGYGA